MSFLDKLLNGKYARSTREQKHLFNHNSFEFKTLSNFFDLQAFNRNSYSKQTDKQLEKSLKGHIKALEEHLKKTFVT